MTSLRDPNIRGECLRCGRCCVLAKVLHYTGHYRDETDRSDDGLLGLTTNDHLDDIKVRYVGTDRQITCHIPCPSYYAKTKACLSQATKRLVCAQWPFSKNDLERVACQGFYYQTEVE
jgi:Fe-S-cluster containining protein